MFYQDLFRFRFRLGKAFLPRFLGHERRMGGGKLGGERKAGRVGKLLSGMSLFLYLFCLTQCRFITFYLLNGSGGENAAGVGEGGGGTPRLSVSIHP